MSGFGKDADPKRFDGGPQKDCDSCGNRDHVQQASKGDKGANDAAQASADRAQKKSGDILGPVLSNPKTTL